jgi:hypothetical protein
MMAKTASADNKELARGQWLAAAEAAGDLVPVIFGIGQATNKLHLSVSFGVVARAMIKLARDPRYAGGAVVGSPCCILRHSS